MSLSRLPWRAIHDVVSRIRRTVFTVPRPDQTLITTPLEVAAVADRLQQAAHFEDGWLMSYNYMGEDANLRRPAGTWTKDGREIQMQLHVRLFARDDGGTDLLVHYEPAPMQHPKLHLLGIGYSVAEAINRTTAVLEELSIGYSTHSSS
ncbi:MAG: hypothetical protein ABEI57_05660 [Halapricum sp.]